jgi:hypothetical protein
LNELLQVKRLTRALYEEVAAPVDFHSRVLNQIHPQVPGLLDRIGTLLDRGLLILRPRVLAPVMASALCLALALVWMPRQTQISQTIPRAVSVSTAKPAPKVAFKAVAPRPAQVAKAIERQAPTTGIAPAAPATSKLVQPPAAAKVEIAQASSLPMPKGGLLDPHDNMAGSSNVAKGMARGAAPSFKAADNTGHPDKTPTLAVPLSGRSQVRNNVVRASKGQTAQILFRLDSDSQVKVEVFSRLGARVAVLADKSFAAGVQELRWDGRDNNGVDQASGIYQVTIQTGTWTAAHKILLVR